MEYFEHGDLLQHAETISNENDIKYIIADVLEGLKFIHPEGFAHRDLKPQVRRSSCGQDLASRSPLYSS